MDGSVSIAMEELRYTCAGFPFAPALVEAGPGDAEQGPEPLAVALRAVLAGGDHGGFLPERGWHLAGEDGQRAEFVAATGDRGMFYVTLQAAPDGWQMSGFGDCQGQVHLAAGLNAATWVFDPGVVGAGCRHAGVRRPGHRVGLRRWSTGRRPILDPWVAADPQRVLVLFAVRAGAGVQTCPGNPSTKVRVDLGEPLGDRQLLDGGRFPAGDPSEPAF